MLNDSLHTVVPAPLALALDAGPPEEPFREEWMPAVLAADTKDRDYWMDVGGLWMARGPHLGEPEPADDRLSNADIASLNRDDSACIQAFIAEMGYRAIDAAEVDYLPLASEDVQANLKLVVEHLSPGCTYEKGLDKHLFSYLKLRTPASQPAAKSESAWVGANGANPGRAANELFRPRIDQATATLPATIRWDDHTDVEGLAGVLGVLLEAVDGAKRGLAVNSQIFHGPYPAIFALVGTGAAIGNVIGVVTAPPTATTAMRISVVRPLSRAPFADAVAAWASTADDHLNAALANHDKLDPRSTLAACF